MMQFFIQNYTKLKKIIFKNSNSDRILLKIQELEKQVRQIELQIKDMHVIKIDNITVDKIFCEKFETNYKIDSITAENLSGTMNIGTTYSNFEPKCASNSEKPKVKLTYK